MTSLSNENSDPWQHSPHGEIHLPLTATILYQLLEQLEKLLGVLSGLCHLVQEAAQHVQDLTLSRFGVCQTGQDVGRGLSR